MTLRSDAKRLLSRRAGSLAMFWHASSMPRDEEWDEALKVLGSPADSNPLKVLVVTEGGAPSPTQQAQLMRILGARTVTVAVLSEVAAVRFVASTLALLLKRVRSFRASDLAAACGYLQLDDGERSAAYAFAKEVVGALAQQG